MPIDVELQGMHSYSFIMIVIVAAFVAVSIVAALILIIKRSQKRKKTVSPKKEITVADREHIKAKYQRLLNELEAKCQHHKLSNRKAYQELSKITRHFVHEATGIKVHNYTLEEIKETNISGLYSVISECYAPEFAVDKKGDIYSSIMKARNVIEEWKE
ncbi:MAG: hypothetical protein IJA10_03105 [Lachnospiraceae bacterium]|nr:hypothetical protein [Lachnospiraceae bacterium]